MLEFVTFHSVVHLGRIGREGNIQKSTIPRGTFGLSLPNVRQVFEIEVVLGRGESRCTGDKYYLFEYT